MPSLFGVKRQQKCSTEWTIQEDLIDEKLACESGISPPKWASTKARCDGLSSAEANYPLAKAAVRLLQLNASKVPRLCENYRLKSMNCRVSEGRMSNFIEGENRQQATMFPERLDDYITEDNSVRVIDVFIDSLDLSGLGFKTEPSNTGRPGYHP